MTPDHVRVLRNGLLTLPDRSLPGDLLIHKGRVSALRAPEQGLGEEIWDLDGRRVAPSLIDLHTHGGWGVDFATASEQEIVQAATHYARVGVSRLLLTLYPGPEDWLTERLAVCARACEACPSLIGIHLEGPFLAVDRRGALPEAGILPFDVALLDRLLTAAAGQLRIMTYAPEAIPVALIGKIQSTGVTLSIGHTSGDADITDAHIAAGVHRSTHLCNAMPTIHHREPGPVVSLLLDSRVRVEVIADGIHLDDRFLKLILAVKGVDGVQVVSDSMPLTGLGACTGEFAGSDVMSDGVRACHENGALAGSVMTLLDALRRCEREVGLAPHQVFRLGASAAAADLLHSGSGTIATRSTADLVVFDHDGSVLATLRAGERIDREQEREGEPLLPEALRVS